MKSSRIQEGSSLQLPAFLNMESHPEPAREFIRLPVMSDDGLRDLRLTDRDLSKHVLTLGGIGCGKTNLIDLMTGQIVTHMTPDDVMVIFDTKGDFLRKFAAPGDIVFGNLTQLPNGVEHAKWNLYREVLIDEDQVQQNLMEVCRSLFLERSRHTTNPFFPNAARDILYGYMMANLRSGPHSQLNNASILHFFQSLDIDALKALFQNQDDLKSCLYYIEGKNQQTQTGYLQNAAYIRLKNIQFGYTFPKAWVNKLGLQYLRVYFSGDNLWTATGIHGYYDPENLGEANSTGGQVYPLSKTYSVGLNINF